MLSLPSHQRRSHREESKHGSSSIPTKIGCSALDTSLPSTHPPPNKKLDGPQKERGRGRNKKNQWHSERPVKFLTFFLKKKFLRLKRQWNPIPSTQTKPDSDLVGPPKDNQTRPSCLFAPETQKRRFIILDAFFSLREMRNCIDGRRRKWEEELSGGSHWEQLRGVQTCEVTL